MRKPPGHVNVFVNLLEEQARLRAQVLTIKQITHRTGLNRSTVQSHLSRLTERERQKAVSHGTSDKSNSVG